MSCCTTRRSMPSILCLVGLACQPLSDFICISSLSDLFFLSLFPSISLSLSISLSFSFTELEVAREVERRERQRMAGARATTLSVRKLCILCTFPLRFSLKSLLSSLRDIIIIIIIINALLPLSVCPPSSHHTHQTFVHAFLNTSHQSRESIRRHIRRKTFLRRTARTGRSIGMNMLP